MHFFFTGLNRNGLSFLRVLMTALVVQMGCLSPSYADFINGNFEALYNTNDPMSNITYNTIYGWTLKGYAFKGNSVDLPTSLAEINLIPSPPPPGPANTLDGISDILTAPTQTLYDYFLKGALTAPNQAPVDQLLPIEGTQAAMINVRWFHTPYAKSGTSKINNWISVGQQATSISQQIVISPTDFDPFDQKVHIRFKAAPVLEDPQHKASQQPFIAIQLNNLSTLRNGSNPLFFVWNYAGQPGVPWTRLSKKGTNAGSNLTYLFTDWQAFDIAPGNSLINVGDTIELIVLASGCSPNGHDGHLYLDGVSTQLPKGLWVVVTGPETATPGEDITYTYTYYNIGTTTVDNIQVNAYMPLPQYPALPASTSYVAVTQPPTVGTDTYCSSGPDPVNCQIGTLEPNQSGQFQIKVHIPETWATTVGPVNNGHYTISGDDVDAVNGPLVQTILVAPPQQSNLIADTSNLTPTEMTQGYSFSGYFTCKNTPIPLASDDAINASCEVTGLPTEFSVSPCTISPNNDPWSQGDTIPKNETVKCPVTGTATNLGTYPVTVTTNADNNTNTTENVSHTTLIIEKTNPPQVVVFHQGDGFENITPIYPLVLDKGSNAVFTVIPHEGFELSLTTGGTCSTGTWSGNTYTIVNVQANCLVTFSAKPIITGSIDGNPISNPVHACCGRPILLDPLRVTGNGPTVFTVISTTGNARCVIGRSGSQSYVKAFGSDGSCTIVGTKEDVTSVPLTIIV
ncbi:MAG: hypothetical protein WC627_11390 [Legionella sp.]|jgi:hypothetical protein